MKNIIAFVILFGLGGVANAASDSNIGVMESTFTAHVVSVSSFTATAVPSQVLQGRTVITLINADTLYGVACGNSAANVVAGKAFTIPAGGSITLNIRDYSQRFAAPMTFYCLTTKTTGATNVSVIQGY